MFGTNSAFRAVEHKEFKGLIDRICPGITLPGRRAIAGRILDAVYEVGQVFKNVG